MIYRIWWKGNGTLNMARIYDSKQGVYVYPEGERVDYNGIKSVCDSIIDVADKFKKAATGGSGNGNLKSVSSDLSKSSKTFTVNGNTYNKNIDTIKDELLTASEAIKEAAKAIKSNAKSKRNTENSQYNTYWRNRDKD